jgi:phage shock protein PspC (stress-responsive transcriptional regulator)
MSHAARPANLGAMNGSDVQHTLREMWETRPARPREGRQIAGVAAAIARRYDIDPVLVRVGFVVAAFYGIGAALYIAGWVLLPDEPATAGTSGRRRPKAWLLILLGIAAVAGLGGMSHAHGGVLLPAAAVAVLLFLLHRSRGGRGIAGPGSAPAPGGPAQAGPGTSLPGARAEGAPSDTVGAGESPPAWDPLGAAPFAWDLPEPSTPPPAPAPRRPPVTPVTLGVALLAGAVTAGILLLAGAFTLANLPVVFGVTLAVLGLGLLVGAFLRTGRGLIPFALLLIVMTWSLLAAPVDRWRDGEVGDLQAAPTTVAALAPKYERSAGEIDLDLRNLDLTLPPGSPDPGPVRTSISMGAGDVQIRVPENADVTFNGSAGVGSVSFDDRNEAGPGTELRVTEDLGADGVRSGRLLVLDVEAGAGNVEVHRG